MEVKDEMINELEILLRHQGLSVFDDKSNPNYIFIHNAIKNQSFSGKGKLLDGYIGCVLEGSSRSGKTWSGVDIIIWLCTQVETDCTINIYRETYNEFKTTLYDDFKRRLDDFGLNNPFHRAQEIKSFKIGKNTIYFLGDGKHGGGCDYAFFNEMMHISQFVFDQVEMRCRKFWWADYNPSYTDHWVFNKVLTRTNVGFLRTTFRQNPFIKHSERIKILGYEPWNPGSYHVQGEDLIYQGKVVDDKNQPPQHPINVANGTADEFMWKVYGLGLRGSMEGVIFNQLTWIDEFPGHVDHTYGNDFGFTNDPNALVKYAEDEKNIWFQLLHYAPVDTDTKLSQIFEALAVEKEKPIACDSSDKYTGENKGTVEMVKGLKKQGWRAFKIAKTKSIMYWIGTMKEKKLHCVKDKDGLWKVVKRERENYKFKEINGILINQPIDRFNHCWDAVRYGHISHNSKPRIFETKETLSEMGIAY